MLLSFVAAAAASGPSRHPHWRIEGELAPEDSVRLLFGLRARNESALFAKAAAVADPKSREFRRYLSLDAVRQLAAPADPERLMRWARAELRATQVEVTLSRDFVTVVAPHAAVAAALSTGPFLSHVHIASGRRVARAARRASLPAAVAGDVDVVQGVFDLLDSPRERRAAAAAVAASRAKATAPPPRGASGEYPACASPDVYPPRTVDTYAMTWRAQVYCSDCSKAVGGGCASNNASAVPPVSGTIKFEYWGGATAVDFLVAQACAADGMCSGVVTLARPMAFGVISATAAFADGAVSAAASPAAPFVQAAQTTPQSLWAEYGVARGAAPYSNATQCVAEFEGEFFSPADLQAYHDRFGLPLDPSLVTVLGSNNASAPGGEATLDIESIMAVARGAPTTFWAITGPGPAIGNSAYLLDWAVGVANLESPPLVTSLSYGDSEVGYVWKFGDDSYMRRLETELAKMATRGLTVAVSSGDAGASNAGFPGNDLSPPSPTCVPLMPQYPSSSKYIVSVGATFRTAYYLPDCQSPLGEPCPEVGSAAVDRARGLPWTTGGGFSNWSMLVPTPAWQAPYVSSYLAGATAAGTLPPASAFNSMGRAYPDVAANGHRIVLVLGGKVVAEDGTSASAPIFAGLLTLVNDALLNAGKPPLGNVAPALYHAPPEVFVDIVLGSNRNANFQPRGSQFPDMCGVGFDAVPGWDPVTGRGAVNFPALLAYLTSL